MALPDIHDRIKKSRLIGDRDLEATSQKICAILGSYKVPSPEPEETSDLDALASFVRSALPSKIGGPDDSLEPGESLRKPVLSNDLDLNDAGVADEFEELLLKKLVKRRLINKWQSSKLHDGHSIFFLGNPEKARYRIISQLGKGGYGAVYHAREERFESNKTVKIKGDVAIKVHQTRSASPEARDSFMREYEIARLFEHENIPEFKWFSNDPRTDFYVLEYVDGGDAEKLIKRYGRLHPHVACYIIMETAKALSYLHRNGLIHRDVKPGNILLMKSGDVRLIDFGFVTPIPDFLGRGRYSDFGEQLVAWEERTALERAGGNPDAVPPKQRGKIKGTPGFIAPEQRRNPDKPSVLWDVYSLGCALYKLVTGSTCPEPPSRTDAERSEWGGYDPVGDELDAERVIPPELTDVPLDLAQYIMKMIAPDPARRVQSAAQVANEMRRWFNPEKKNSFNSVLLASSQDSRSIWGEENIRKCFDIPETMRYVSAPTHFDVLTERTNTGTSVSTAFFEAFANDPAFNQDQALSASTPPSAPNPQNAPPVAVDGADMFDPNGEPVPSAADPAAFVKTLERRTKLLTLFGVVPAVLIDVVLALLLLLM